MLRTRAHEVGVPQIIYQSTFLTELSCCVYERVFD